MSCVVLGILIALLSLISNDWRGALLAVGFGQIACGIFNFLLYYVENSRQYLTIKNGVIIKKTIFPKRISLSEIKSIKEFAGKLKLKTEESVFIIDTQIIAPHSLVELKKELQNFHVS